MSKVLPVKVSKPPVVVLPHTGAALPVGPTVGGAIALLGLGLLLLVRGRGAGCSASCEPTPVARGQLGRAEQVA